MIVHADPDTGVLGFKLLENRKHEDVKCDLTDGYRNATTFKETVGVDLIFSFFDQVIGGFNMFEQFFSFRCQGHSFFRADEQAAAEVRFQCIDDTGDVRLVVVKKAGGLRKTSVLSDEVEDLIVFPVTVHDRPHINFI